MIRPCTVDTIGTDGLPTPLPGSPVTNIAGPEVVDKVRGSEGLPGGRLGMAGVQTVPPNEGYPGAAPTTVTVAALTDGSAFDFFVFPFCFRPSHDGHSTRRQTS